MQAIYGQAGLYPVNKTLIEGLDVLDPKTRILDQSRIGPVLTGDPRIAGVAFTGSTETAQLINRSLAARDGALPALIAETGGQNVMLVDSSALPEQVVSDAVTCHSRSIEPRDNSVRAFTGFTCCG